MLAHEAGLRYGLCELPSSASLVGHVPSTNEEVPMSRDTDWHVFDKACDITAMAARGSAATADPAQLAQIFREIHAALHEVATAMDSGPQRTGF